MDLAKRGAANPAEEEHLAALKQEMADLLLSRPAPEVYDVAVLKP